MSHIDDLIAEHCPDGVEYRALGEVARLKNGRDHKHLGDGTVPVYGSGGVMRYVDQPAAAGPAVLIPRKGSLGNIFYVEGPFWVVDTIFRTEIDQDIVIPKWLYYVLQTMRLDEMNQAGGVPSQTQTVLNRLRVPTPPLPVQHEIVRILDQFTALEAELEAELEARRKQYEYYRSTVLEIPYLEETKALGSLAEFRYGYTAKAEDSGAYRFLRITDISDSGKLNTDGAKYIRPTQASEEYIVESGDILVARTGATFGKTLLVEEDQFQAIYASFLIRIRFHTGIVIPSFYWHFAQSDLYWRQANALVSRSSQPQFNANAMKLLQVPVPPLEAQRRIAAILDEFDALVNDISVGLPAELAARRKQYEYYRDKLLTFKEKAS